MRTVWHWRDIAIMFSVAIVASAGYGWSALTVLRSMPGALVVILGLVTGIVVGIVIAVAALALRMDR